MNAPTPPPGFPFTAVVGHEDLRLGLILNAISPRIGGVCVRGEKGTAKTTLVRGFQPLINGSLVNLPLGATEDRVVGSLDVETILTTGKAEYRPGLLAQADGGILYVDEVNLLADHLVDSLLDAASTGVVTIERDGISYTARSRFVLVGTMNPEEGELRPQLLDRFGLSVTVEASKDPQVRQEIVLRRLAFEADPTGYAAQWADKERDLAERLRCASERVAAVHISKVQIARIAELCAAFDVDGMRADLVIARAAVAHAAWRGSEKVDDNDIRVVARLALPHRVRRNPFDAPGIDAQQLDDALDDAVTNNPETAPQDPVSSEENTPEPPDLNPPQNPDDDNDSPDDAARDDEKGDNAVLGDRFRSSISPSRRAR